MVGTTTPNCREGLSESQLAAASHSGSHARLLAGPGTGKTRTLTRRVLSLICDKGVSPDKILVLTFTRVAAFQFRQELSRILEPAGVALPRVSTLHSFALRQLLLNSTLVRALPQPLRIADDWEERHVVQEDLKRSLQKDDIREVQHLLAQLSADFETLEFERYDATRAELPYRDPKFFATWRSHRHLLGYTLRAELVYQLKRALNQHPAFRLEAGFQHLVVDEYQDLNACDLAVVKELTRRGMELFAAGDDDQSIYGFRYADPNGIRDFLKVYPGAADLALDVCYRCDSSILGFAEFVADLDVDRIPKPTRSRPGADAGEVRLVCFSDQYKEALVVGHVCHDLINAHGVNPSDILILVRSDQYRKMSTVLSEALRQAGVPVSEQPREEPLDGADGRAVLAFLRLLGAPDDGLAWRTLLLLRAKGVGDKSIDAVSSYARDRNIPFGEALASLAVAPSALPRFGTRVAIAVRALKDALDGLTAVKSDLRSLLADVTDAAISEPTRREEVMEYLLLVATETGSDSLGALLQALASSLQAGEQELYAGAVNILTMHKAKGLSANTVFIIGVEDELIPGTAAGHAESDERRLLYVSMTRAEHHLVLTYCQERKGQQQWSGRSNGTSARRLSRFLQDAPIQAEFVS